VKPNECFLAIAMIYGQLHHQMFKGAGQKNEFKTTTPLRWQSPFSSTNLVFKKFIPLEGTVISSW
jgi:hypothetical protein